MSSSKNKTTKKTTKSPKKTSKNTENTTSEMTVEKYVELSLQIMPKVLEVLIQKMKDISQSAEGESVESENPFDIVGKFLMGFMEAISTFEDDFQVAGISSQDFNSWADLHKEELEEYFTKNPKAKEQFDVLKMKLEGIMQGNLDA